MHLTHEPDPRSLWSLIPFERSVGGKYLSQPAILSFNHADLILVTYLVTEKHSASHSQSTPAFSGLCFSRMRRHTNVRCVYGFVVFPSYVVSRLCDSTQLQQTASEAPNRHACAEEGWYNNVRHTGPCVMHEGGPQSSLPWGGIKIKNTHGTPP